LSGIIGSGAKLVHLRIKICDENSSVKLQFRTNGNTNEKNVGMVTTQVTGVYVTNDVFVWTDSNGVIEYNGDSILSVAALIVVAGWFD